MKHIRLFLLALLTSFTVVESSLAVEKSDELPLLDVLLRNVTLLNRGEQEQSGTVNLLIKSGKVDLITSDHVSRDEADLIYDAKGGFLIGQVKPGEPASFLIIEGDLRGNIELLLDTKTHASFAMVDGLVIRNRYRPVNQRTLEEEKAEQGGWLAYAPPPLAFPLNYNDTSRWNRFDTGPVSGIFAAAVLLDRQHWVDQDDNSEIQVGDLKEYEVGEIRGLRFGGVGTLNFEHPWVWTVFAATHAFDKGFDVQDGDDVTLFDLRLDVPIWRKVSFSIGKQKEPISMERMMSMVHLPMQERSAVADALLPSRNIGVVLAGTAANDRITMAGGAFNNWLDRDQPSSFEDNATQYIGRLTGVALESEDGSALLHLGLAYRYSDGVEGMVVRTEPEFYSAPNFIESNPFAVESTETWQYEASLRRGPFWLHGEYIDTQTESSELLDPNPGGYHVTASWVLSGEMRPYNKRVGIFGRVPISRSVNQNGMGAWEISTRFSNLDTNDGLLEGGDMDIWSAGLNWWLNPYFNVNLNYRFITLDRKGITGESHGFNARVALMLE
jgi:phosphate-selective porin OprO/OprP